MSQEHPKQAPKASDGYEKPTGGSWAVGCDVEPSHWCFHGASFSMINLGRKLPVGGTNPLGGTWKEVMIRVIGPSSFELSGVAPGFGAAAPEVQQG